MQFAERFEDMSPRGRLRVMQQDDGDMIVEVVEDLNSTSPAAGLSAAAEFCTSGGKSPKTLAALRALMRAMAEENQERPHCLRRGEHGLGVDTAWPVPAAVALAAPAALPPLSWMRCEDGLPEIPADERTSRDVLAGMWIEDSWLREDHPERRRFIFGACRLMRDDDRRNYPKGSRWLTFGPSHNEITHWTYFKPPSELSSVPVKSDEAGTSEMGLDLGGLSRSDAEFWLRNRKAIIEACSREGFSIVTTAQGVSLLRLGRAEAQVNAPGTSSNENRG